MKIDPLSLLRDHLDSLYRVDPRGRLTAINQWDGGPVPYLHLCRSTDAHCWRFRADLDEATIRALDRLCRAEPPLDDPRAGPLLAAAATDALGGVDRIQATWHGPVYAFPAAVPDAGGDDIVAIDPGNARLLQALLPQWLSDVPHRQPFLAALIDGQAAAVCASVRISAAVHAAGVETHPAFRGRGLASSVVAAWSEAVRQLHAEPVYSTSWDNLASQGVARRLGLELIGTDFHLR